MGLSLISRAALEIECEGGLKATETRVLPIDDDCASAGCEARSSSDSRSTLYWPQNRCIVGERQRIFWVQRRLISKRSNHTKPTASDLVCLILPLATGSSAAFAAAARNSDAARKLAEVGGSRASLRGVNQ